MHNRTANRHFTGTICQKGRQRLKTRRPRGKETRGPVDLPCSSQVRCFYRLLLLPASWPGSWAHRECCECEVMDVSFRSFHRTHRTKRDCFFLSGILRLAAQHGLCHMTLASHQLTFAALAPTKAPRYKGGFSILATRHGPKNL